MENRRKLRENSLVLIIVGIFDLLLFGATIVDGFVTGAFNAELEKVDASLVSAVKIGLIVVGVIMALLVAADIFLGIKGMKVSANPTAKKGYITVAKVFMIMTCFAVISHAINIFGGKASALDSGMNLASAALSICIYVLFVNAAEAVRKDVIEGKK